jgi:hypothetical protein
LNKPLLKKMKTALAQLLMKRIERLTVFEMNRVAEWQIFGGPQQDERVCGGGGCGATQQGKSRGT